MRGYAHTRGTIRTYTNSHYAPIDTNKHDTRHTHLLQKVDHLCTNLVKELSEQQHETLQQGRERGGVEAADNSLSVPSAQKVRVCVTERVEWIWAKM